MTRSVRFRLTVWYAVLLLGALFLFSGAIWLSLLVLAPTYKGVVGFLAILVILLLRPGGILGVRPA